jgi:prepilin-type N-terminal cleavage/methylation domain-containing protein
MHSRRSPRPPPPASPRAGYSVAEMMVVIAIIGTATAMAVPRLDSSGRQAAAAGHVAGMALVAAQRAAVARQHDVVVAVDAPGRALRVHYDADGDGRVDDGELVRRESLGEGAVFGRGSAPAWLPGPAAVSFRGRQDGMPAVTFHRSGSASEEGGFYVTSARAQAGGLAKHARAVVVDRATGRPGWASYTGATWTRDF